MGPKRLPISATKSVLTLPDTVAVLPLSQSRWGWCTLSLQGRNHTLAVIETSAKRATRERVAQDAPTYPPTVPHGPTISDRARSNSGQ